MLDFKVQVHGAPEEAGLYSWGSVYIVLGCIEDFGKSDEPK